MNIESGRYSRHEAFIPLVEQEKLHRAKVLIAGCGAGSPVASHLARLGVGTQGEITFADPDTVETNNLNRQAYEEPHIGQKKVQALTDVMHKINRNVKVKTIIEGITGNNVEQLIKNNDVIVEMVDIAAPGVTFAIHEMARKYNKPLVTGMDVGEGVIVSVFDYRDLSQLSYRDFLGISENIPNEDLMKLSPLGLALQYLIGPVDQQFQTIKDAKNYYENIFNIKGTEIFEALPKEMHMIAQQLVANNLEHIPQSGIAAGLLGVTQAAVIKEIILGHKVKTAPEMIQLNMTDFISK